MAFYSSALQRIQGASPSATGMAGDVLASSQRAGLLDPTGGNGLGFRLRRRGALRNADNIRRREMIRARLSGLDPAQARVAAINADTAASGSVADSLNAGQEAEFGQNRDFARRLFRDRLGYEDQRGLLKYQHDLNRPTLGGTIGGLVGQAAGAFAGSAGGLLRRRPAPNPMGEASYGGGGYDPYQG